LHVSHIASVQAPWQKIGVMLHDRAENDRLAFAKQAGQTVDAFRCAPCEDDHLIVRNINESPNSGAGHFLCGGRDSRLHSRTPVDARVPRKQLGNCIGGGDHRGRAGGVVEEGVYDLIAARKGRLNL
jgi:hypothetical protein